MSPPTIDALREAVDRAMEAVESLPVLPTRRHNRAISQAHHALMDARAAAEDLARLIQSEKAGGG